MKTGYILVKKGATKVMDSYVVTEITPRHGDFIGGGRVYRVELVDYVGMFFR